VKRFFLVPSWFFILCALAFALIAQYGFGIEPCQYCLYQRYLFILAAFFFILPRTFFLGQLMLIAGLCLSVYQIGLEQHFWTDFIQACKTPTQTFDSLEAMQQALKATPIKQCDEINWRILGISATIWTALFQLCLIPYGMIRRNLMRRKFHEKYIY